MDRGKRRARARAGARDGSAGRLQSRSLHSAGRRVDIELGGGAPCRGGTLPVVRVAVATALVVGAEARAGGVGFLFFF